MKRGKRAFAALLTLSMLAVLLAGCGPRIDVTKYSQPGAEAGSIAGQGAGQDAAAGQESGAGGQAAVPAELTYANGTTLRMATGYNSVKTGLSFDAETYACSNRWQREMERHSEKEKGKSAEIPHVLHKHELKY